MKTSLKLWQDIQAEEAEKVKLKKADRIERIASVMSDAALFEGFCLAFYGKDETGDIVVDGKNVIHSGILWVSDKKRTGF